MRGNAFAFFVISSIARNPYDVASEASFYETVTIPMRRITPLNVIASGAKQSPPRLARRLPRHFVPRNDK
jgi:hypothetical protein